jgi:uncharacterized membrane protein
MATRDTSKPGQSGRKATPRHLGFYLSVAAGILAAVVVSFVARQLSLVVGANVFFAGYVVSTYLQLHRLDAVYLRKHAVEEDAPAPFILFVTVAAVVASAASLFVALAESGFVNPIGIALNAVSVVLGWLAIHTVWAMHYAFEYYDEPKTTPGSEGGRGVVGGLEFAGGEAPDGTAFLYFSYVIGMTAQTSDTAVTSNAMRRIVTLHAIFSFFFNTVILAAAVNIVVSLGR